MSSFKSLVVAFLLVLTPSTVLAQTPYRWVGTTSGDWNTATNWLNDTTSAAVAKPPDLSTESAIFSQTSTNTTLTLASSILLQSIQFNATPAAYTIGGQGITITSGGSVSVASTVATNQTINSNITASGSFGVTNSSATANQLLSFGGTIALGSNALTVNTTANTTISGAITGTSASSITKSGNGVLSLSGTNSSYAGPLTVNAGTLNVSGTGTTGAGALTVNSGGRLAGTGTVTGQTTINVGGSIRGDTGTGTGKLNLNGTTTLIGKNQQGDVASIIRSTLAVSSGNITNNSQLSLGADGVLNLSNLQGTNRGIDIYLDNDAGLINGKTYTITLATAGTNTTQFQRNGEGKNSGNGLFGAGDANLFSGTGSNTFTNVLLKRDATNTLDLTFTAFTAVPEPSLMFGAATGLFGLVALWRKKANVVVA